MLKNVFAKIAICLAFLPGAAFAGTTQIVVQWLDSAGNRLLWDDIEITAAVGKWHLAAHVQECFTKFSLNFIEGSAEVDSKIMEMLWSSLDLVVGITQGMTIAHHQEVLDDYINDNNWKKLLNLCTSFLMMLTFSIHTLNSNHTRL